MNDKYWDLVYRLVPDHSAAKTVQGELARAVLRLTAECSRNGCGNWDGYFEALAEFAWDMFSDGTLDVTIAERARSIVARLRDYGRGVQPQSEAAYDQLCSDMDAPLEEAVVQWCDRHLDQILFLPAADKRGLD